MSDLDFREKIKIISDSQKSLHTFATKIFAKSFGNFIDGEYVEDVCQYLQKYDRTMRIAFRSGFKSNSLYMYIMHAIMFRGMKENLDIKYFSYNERMSGDHILRIKTSIENNPFFSELINLKAIAENTAAYTWDRKHIIRLRPAGIISFSRGAKTDLIFADDIYADPVNPIHPNIILKINDIFKAVVMETLRPGGEIHMVGTPLSRADMFFDPVFQKEFHAKFSPGIITDKDGKEVSAWPEFYTVEQLKNKLPILGERAFQSEILCNPAYSSDSFFKKEQLRKTVVNPNLRNIRIIEGYNTENIVVAGLDIGKKKHPSSLVIFELKNGKAIMLHHRVMKKWPYYSGKRFDPFRPSQVEYCKEAIKNFSVNALYYDNTRGEFEGASDAGQLSPQFIPIVFTPKMKIQMATNFEKAVVNKQIEIIDNEEMLNSICSVTNDLQKIEDSTGSHGDDFDSIALALLGYQQSENIGREEKISAGGLSLFDGGQLPKHW